MCDVCVVYVKCVVDVFVGGGMCEWSVMEMTRAL